MKIQFQFWPKGKDVPNEIDVTDVYQEVPDGAIPPSIGDCVYLSWESGSRVKSKAGVVRSRHYTFSENQMQDDVKMVIVEIDPDDPNYFVRG